MILGKRIFVLATLLFTISFESEAAGEQWSSDAFRNRTIADQLRQVQVGGTLACVGDSFTSYFGGCGAAAGRLLTSNFGVPGSTIAETIKRLDAIAALGPAGIQVWIGANDAKAINDAAPGMPADRKGAVLGGLFRPLIDKLAALAAAGFKVALVSLPPGPNLEQAAVYAKANKSMKAMVAATGTIGWISTAAMAGPRGEIIAANWISPFNSHPNLTGYLTLEAARDAWIELAFGPAPSKAWLDFEKALRRGGSDPTLALAVGGSEGAVAINEPWSAALLFVGLLVATRRVR